MTGRYPEGSAILVRFPRTPAEQDGPRDGWGWFPGTVTEQCGPDEWEIEMEDGAVCFRDATEIRPAAGRGER